MFGGLADSLAIQGGTATARTLSGASWATRGTNIEADAAESPAVSTQIDGHWAAISGWRGAQNTLFGSMKTLAEKVLIEQVDLDAHLPVKDLTSALTELFRQMKANSDSIQQSTVAIGSQTDVGTPTGDPVSVASIKNAQGYTLQTLYAEIIRFTVTGDRNGSATSRQEPFTVKGQSSVDVTAYNWPQGSGGSQSMTLVDAQLDNSGGNKLTNSDFETFTTANHPDNWTIGIGAAGTDVFAAGAGYTQNNALKLTGDGATLIALRQTFNTTASTTVNAGGTPGRVAATTQYAVHGKIKVSAAPSTGVLRVALVDSTNTVINDDAGTANSFTVDLTALTTSYASFSGTFRTPTALPTTVKLELKTTTAIESGKSAYIDDLAFAEMTALYKGGPSFAFFAAATNVVLGDAWTRTTTNSMGVMASWLERIFSLSQKGLQASYASSPTVADSLVA